MKVLLATPFYPPFGVGGGPVSAHNMATTLATLGHELRVLTVGDEAGMRELDGIPVHTVKSPNIYWNFFEPHSTREKLLWHALENYNPAAKRMMTKALIDFQPALLLTISIENINVASWAAAKALNIPILHLVHSGYLMCWKGTMRKGDNNCAQQCTECRLSSFGKRRLSQLVDAVSGETNFIIDRHVSAGYFRKARTEAIPSSIDRVHANGPRQLPNDRPFRVGFLGVHIPYKGLDTLAKAAHLIKERGRDPAPSQGASIEFHIAGEGDSAYARDIRSRFPPENTIFHGWVDAAAFLPTIDVLVVPSIGNEPFGRVCVEAFSHALPVLGSRTGGIPETVTPGLNGDLFDRGDAKALAHKLCALASDRDLYAHWSKGALKSAAAYCDDQIGPRLQALVESVIARPNKPQNAGAGNLSELPS